MAPKSKSKGGKKSSARPLNLRFPSKDLQFSIGTIVKGGDESSPAGRIVNRVMGKDSIASILYYEVVYDDGFQSLQMMTHEQLMPLVEQPAPASPNENVSRNDVVVLSGATTTDKAAAKPSGAAAKPPLAVATKEAESRSVDYESVKVVTVDSVSETDQAVVKPSSTRASKRKADAKLKADAKDSEDSQSDSEEEWDGKASEEEASDEEQPESEGSDDVSSVEVDPSPAKRPAKKPKTAVSSSAKKVGAQMTLFGAKAPSVVAKAAPKRDRKPKTNGEGEPYSVGDYTKKPYSAGDGLPVISEPQLMFDDMVQEQLPKIHGKHLLMSLLEKTQGRPLHVATMCSGTESPILALDMMQQSLRDLVAQDESFGHLDPEKVFPLKHVFSCEIEYFKQAYIENNFSPPLLFRDIRELGKDQAHTAYGSLADVPNKPGCVDILIAGTSCVDYSNLNTKKVCCSANHCPSERSPKPPHLTSCL